MQNLINKILKLLKNKVSQNNSEIQHNQDEIRRILSADKLPGTEKDELNDRNLINEELFMENEDFLHMQLQLSEFIEKHGHLFSTEENDEILQEEEAALPYFTKTIEGELNYEPGHPQFSNIRFFNKLLKYYQEKENYEMCDQLVKIKRAGNKF